MSLDKKLPADGRDTGAAIPKIIGMREAIEMVSTPVRLPDFSEKFFGKDNMAMLRDLLCSDVVRDLDVLYLTGSISEEEEIEYALVLEEAHELLLKLRALAKKMAEDVRHKATHYLKDLKPRYTNNACRANTSGLHKFLGGRRAICYAPDSTRYTPFFLTAYSYFVIELERALCCVAYDALLQQYPDTAKIDTVLLQLSTEKDPNSTLENKQYSYAAYLNAMHVYSTDLRNAADGPFARLFAQAASFPCSGTDDVTTWREIQELSIFRSIDFSVRLNGYTIKFSSIGMAEDAKISRLRRPFLTCLVQIEADSEDNAGRKINLCGAMDRVTGDLGVGSGADLARFAGEAAAMYVKRMIYKLLLDYLRSKPEDIERAPIHKPQKIVEEIRNAAENTITDALPAVQNQLAETAETANTTAATAEQQMAGLCTIADAKKQPSITISNLRGHSAGRIKNALDKLLGQPVRIRGSHHVYRTREGRTYPIALHNTDSVGIGMLNTCLREFGISPAELAARL